MNDITKRIIAIILAALLLLSLAVSVFAEEPEYSYYFCMCDSLGNKTGGEMGERTDKAGWLPNSYPDLVSKYYGLTGANQHFYGGRAGWRTNEIRYLLDDSFRRDAFANNEDWLHDFGYYTIAYMDNLRKSYREALSKADLITVNIGSNDLIGNLAYSAVEVLKYNSVQTPCSEAILSRIEEAKEKYSDEEAIVKILEILASAENGALLVQNVLTRFAQVMYNYGSNWDEMMKAVYKYAPEDATVVVIGLFNPISSMITANSEIPKGLADIIAAGFQGVVDYVNWYISKGSRYASEYAYADVSDVDLTGSDDGAHLAIAGHKYFFDQIVTAVNSTKPCDHSFGTTTVNYKKPGKLTAGYSGDSKCVHCGAIIAKGHVLSPTLFK